MSILVSLSVRLMTKIFTWGGKVNWFGKMYKSPKKTFISIYMPNNLYLHISSPYIHVIHIAIYVYITCPHMRKIVVFVLFCFTNWLSSNSIHLVANARVSFYGNVIVQFVIYHRLYYPVIHWWPSRSAQYLGCCRLYYNKHERVGVSFTCKLCFL